MKNQPLVLPRPVSIAILLVLVVFRPLSAQEHADGWSFKLQEHDIQVMRDDTPIATFVFHDEVVRRPYLCHVKTIGGLQVTRSHPPVAGKDAVDHDTMHPGIWLGFGDISGIDFWRNKGTIRHVRMTLPPQVIDDRLTFETESQLLNPDGHEIGSVINRLIFIADKSDWMVCWKATFRAKGKALNFGDQEEMGFGARVATVITEKNGGVILSSTGNRSAKDTWGQAADWCDYSGSIDDKPVGITLMSSPNNFRPSWWHNRDYGVFVANPFGRKAMGQGDVSSVVVEPSAQLRLEFSAVIHEGAAYAPEDWFKRLSVQ